MDNERKQPRIPFDAAIEVILGDGRKQPGQLTNISAGGTFVQTEPLPEFGQKIKIHVRLPGIQDECEIPCIVRWVKKDEGAGLQFEHLRPIEVWALNKIKHTDKETA
ncbi:MAG: PilZ domain-containing protein [Proteobacteria bacterium]|nr:PilZ domain-containing protein [Pseudomonadota bacterium]